MLNELNGLNLPLADIGETTALPTNPATWLLVNDSSLFDHWIIILLIDDREIEKVKDQERNVDSLTPQQMVRCGRVVSMHVELNFIIE